MEGIIEVSFPNGISQIMGIVEAAQIREIYGHEVYERKRKVKKGDIVIDIGACNGMFSLKAIAQGAEKVIAVEPHPDNVKTIHRNYERNSTWLKTLLSFHSIRILETALAHKTGFSILQLSDTPGGHSIKLIKNRKRGFKVRTRTLDYLLQMIPQYRHYFVKIDAEGVEPEILLGGQKFLAQDNVFLSMAAYHYAKEMDEIIDVLKSFGYEHEVYDLGLFLGGRFVYGWK